VSISISKVLQVLDNPQSLENWRKRVGYEEAERISKRSATVGTAMHKFLEHWIMDDKDCIDETEEGILGKKMAHEVYKWGIERKLEEKWHTEGKVNFKDLYHGRLDLAGIWEGEPCVIDFKQSNTYKKKEWVWKYMCQLAAYAMAYNKTFDKPKIKKGVVLMCTQNLQFLKFELKGSEFIKACQHFKKALRFCNDNKIFEIKPEHYDLINNFRRGIGLYR
jgi:ATP-dependent exoDNAse (exonuclease V) beta subunit